MGQMWDGKPNVDKCVRGNFGVGLRKIYIPWPITLRCGGGHKVHGYGRLVAHSFQRAAGIPFHCNVAHSIVHFLLLFFGMFTLWCVLVSAEIHIHGRHIFTPPRVYVRYYAGWDLYALKLHVGYEYQTVVRKYRLFLITVEVSEGQPMYISFGCFVYLADFPIYNPNDFIKLKWRALQLLKSGAHQYREKNISKQIKSNGLDKQERHFYLSIHW